MTANHNPDCANHNPIPNTKIGLTIKHTPHSNPRANANANANNWTLNTGTYKSQLTESQERKLFSHKVHSLVSSRI